MRVALKVSRSTIAAQSRGSVKVLDQPSGRPVAGDDQGSALSLGDELIEVIGLGGGQLAHSKVVEDEQIGADEFADAFLPGAVRVAAGEFGEDAAGLGEADVRALADRKVAQCLGNVCLSDPDRAEQNYGLAGVEPAQCDRDFYLADERSIWRILLP